MASTVNLEGQETWMDHRKYPPSIFSKIHSWIESLHRQEVNRAMAAAKAAIASSNEKA